MATPSVIWTIENFNIQHHFCLGFLVVTSKWGLIITTQLGTHVYTYLMRSNLTWFVLSLCEDLCTP